MFLINFTLRKLLISVLQRFLKVFIPCLTLMIVEKLQLAVVRETGFENQVGVTGRAFNAATKMGIQIAV